MINAYQEQAFYHYILENDHFLTACQPDFFAAKNIRLAYEVASEFAKEYKEAPSSEQMQELIHIKGLNESLSNDVIIALYNSKNVLEQYEKQWLDDNVSAWIKVQNAQLAFRKGAAYLKSTSVTAENASEVVENLKHMMTTDMTLDFEFKRGSDFFDPKSHLQTRLARTPTGYEYIDKCLKGGWWKGMLTAFLSGPKTGKSLWMQNLAVLSSQNGYNTAYITLELQEELVNMRFGSNLLDIHIDDYEEKAKDQDYMRMRLNGIKEKAFIPYGVLDVKEFPSSTASVNDIRAYLKKMEEILGIKFDNVFIDYINIMRNWRNPNSENTYMKIKQISEDLRAMAMEELWAVITVTQTNKDGWENEDLRISNVSESSALLHTVDALFGIITSPEMKARKMYYLKYLADRVSGMENTRKKFNVDTKFMRIEEDKNSTIEDMDFVLNSVLGNQKKPRGTAHVPKDPNPPIHNAKGIEGDDIDLKSLDIFSGGIG